MGLTVRMVHITRDESVFGRSFFYDCETELYDPDTDSMVKERIPAGTITILVDKTVAFMRVLGAINNTIVHECVHWDKHKKSFALAKLYNKELTNIDCVIDYADYPYAYATNSGIILRPFEEINANEEYAGLN